MEQQILPLGTGAVMSRPPEPTSVMAYPIHRSAPGETSAATMGGWNYAANNTQQQNNVYGGNKACGITAGLCCLCFVVMGIFGAVAGSPFSDYSNSLPTYPTPCYTK